MKIDGKAFGMIDSFNSLYQLGGSGGKCVLWKSRVLGLGIDEWDYISQRVAVIEFIDHDKNQAWRVTTEVAAFLGEPYLQSGRRRFGIPISCFDVYDADGTWLRKGL